MHSFSDLTYRQLLELSDHWLKCDDTRRALIAAKLDASQSYIDRSLSFFRNFEDKRQQAQHQHQQRVIAPLAPQTAPQQSTPLYLPHYPPSPTRVYNDWIEVTTDNAMVIADVELPDYDPLLMRLMHAVALRFGIKKLVIGGDFWAFDSISSWPSVVRETADGLLEDDYKLSEGVLNTAFGWFDDIYAVMGNHDRRFNYMLGGQLGPYRALHLADGKVVKVNIYAHLYLKTSRGPIMVVHPKNYSKNQLTVPVDLETIEPERCHILSTHTHHCCSGFDKSGKWEVHEIGCMRDPSRTRYKQLNKTRHPQWVQGFVMVRNGYIYRFPKDSTDWLLWLGPELYGQIFEQQEIAA